MKTIFAKPQKKSALPNDQTPETNKQVYRSPKLICYGSVKEITNGSGAGTVDGFTGANVS